MKKTGMVAGILLHATWLSGALASQGTIYVKNSANHDAYVTVVDLNNSNSVAMSDKRINSDDMLPVAVEIGGSGFAKVKWNTEKR